jgi:hypothetical protein
MRFTPHTSQPSALDEWRAAAALVQDRWAQVLTADRHSRRSAAYAAYRAALDAEELAAAVLAGQPQPLAA